MCPHTPQYLEPSHHLYFCTSKSSVPRYLRVVANEGRVKHQNVLACGFFLDARNDIQAVSGAFEVYLQRPRLAGHVALCACVCVCVCVCVRVCVRESVYASTAVLYIVGRHILAFVCV